MIQKIIFFVGVKRHNKLKEHQFGEFLQNRLKKPNKQKIKKNIFLCIGERA